MRCWALPRDASAKDIKSAYRKLAKRYHPDQNPDDPKAKDRFAAANQAYEIVGDEKSEAGFRPRRDRRRGQAALPGLRRRRRRPVRRLSQAAGRARPHAFRVPHRARPIRSPAAAPRTFSASSSGSPSREAPAAPAAPAAADLNVTLDVTIEQAANAEKVTAIFPDGRKIAVKLPTYVEDGQTIRLKGQGEQGLGAARRRAGQDPLPPAPALSRRGPRSACRSAGAARRCRARRQGGRRHADGKAGRQCAGLVEFRQGASPQGPRPAREDGRAWRPLCPCPRHAARPATPRWKR